MGNWVTIGLSGCGSSTRKEAESRTRQEHARCSICTGQIGFSTGNVASVRMHKVKGSGGHARWTDPSLAHAEAGSHI